MNKFCVFCTSDNPYVPYCTVALLAFKKYNPEFDMFIIGKNFNQRSILLCNHFNIKIIKIDLDEYFYKNWDYPVECYYHFKGPDIFSIMGYDFSVFIDGDIYCNNKLEIDWSNLEHIGGVGYITIKYFLNKLDDYEKIVNVFGKNKFDRLHTQAGVIIYNNHNLNKINYFKKVTEIFDRSIKNDIPRKGDDSLLALVIGLYPEINVTYLSKNYNFINKINSDYLTTFSDIINTGVLIHLMQYKPWKICSKYPNYTYKYFVEKWREMMINNFSQNEIKNYFPKIYKQSIIHPENIKFYWYQENVINFGDQITKYLVKKISGIDIKNPINPNTTKKTVLLGVGSIMRLCDKNTIVWGSGIRDIDQKVKGGKIIRSVRGPLTRERLIKNGYECPPIYGDPGLLLSRFYKPLIEKIYNIGIIPHFSQYQYIYEMYEKEVEKGEVIIIDLRTDDIEGVINRVLACKKIVSSSLHGIVVANSYDIPVRWIKYDNNIYGDDTKYYDHFLSIGLKDENYIDAVKYKKISINSLLNLISGYKISINLKRLLDASFFYNGSISKFIRYNL